MSRAARTIIPGIAHHVTQRGNHRSPVFFADRDRLVYLSLLRRYCSKHAVRVLNYCLMGNHVHLLVIPEKADSLARGLGRAHNDYARWLHVQHGQTGHLWQNRFFSCPVSDDDVAFVARYIELNPVRAGLAQEAWKWRWSSAHAHIAGIDEAGLADLNWWQQHSRGSCWKSFLEMGLDDNSLGRIRIATTTGRPLGSTHFVRDLEERLGRPLGPRKRGRPKLVNS